MLKPEFSEFTFGYAFTENFSKGWIGGGVTGVPIFPSLNQEGKLEVGYDVAIPTHAEPILFQFKIPQIVRRRSRFIPPQFHTPYYRMHLEPGARSTQHRALLQHAAAGRRVYYVSTQFDLLNELNWMFQSGEVPDHCVFFKPHTIGHLDEGPHFVAYEKSPHTAWLFSEPKEIAAPQTGEAIRSEVRSVAREAPAIGPRREYFARLSDEIVRSVRRAVTEEDRTLMERRDATSFQGGDYVDDRLRGVRNEQNSDVAGQRELYIYEELRSFPVRDLLSLADETSRIEEPLTRFAALATFVLDCHVVLVGHTPEVQ